MSYEYQESVPAGARGPMNGPSGGARAGSATTGVVLIVAGAVLLAAQFVPGLEWWTLWPLLIVLAGFIQLVTPGHSGWGVERLSEAFGTVFLGAVLLGCTTGYIGWEMWLTALALWPTLIVMAGVALLGRATGQSWLAALAPLPVWLAIAYAAASTMGGVPFDLPQLQLVLYSAR